MSCVPKPDARTGQRYYSRRPNEPVTRIRIWLYLTEREHQRFMLEAKARNLRPNGLGRMVVENVIQDGLFKAVLDN